MWWLQLQGISWYYPTTQFLQVLIISTVAVLIANRILIDYNSTCVNIVMSLCRENLQIDSNVHGLLCYWGMSWGFLLTLCSIFGDRWHDIS